MNGARAAGITGSGPALAIFAPSISRSTIDRLHNWYQKYDDVEIMETTIINAEFDAMDE